MAPAGHVRVMLVDDYALVRAGVRDLLDGEDDLEVVAEAGLVKEAVEQADLHQPDVVLMDLHLPDGSGIEATREIRSRRPETVVVMLTGFPDEQAVLAAVFAGASAYVLKDVSSKDILQTIRTVAKDGSRLDRRHGMAVVSRLASNELYGTDRMTRLSAQERRILNLLPEGKTNREIAAELCLSEKTVKNYISSILTKLGVARRTEAAAYAARRRTSPNFGV